MHIHEFINEHREIANFETLRFFSKIEECFLQEFCIEVRFSLSIYEIRRWKFNSL